MKNQFIIIHPSTQYPPLHNRSNLSSTPTTRKNYHTISVIPSVGNKQHPPKRRTNSLVNQMQFQSVCNRSQRTARGGKPNHGLLGIYYCAAKSCQLSRLCQTTYRTFASLICANQRDGDDGDADLFPFGCTILFPFPCRFIAGCELRVSTSVRLQLT